MLPKKAIRSYRWLKGFQGDLKKDGTKNKNEYKVRDERNSPEKIASIPDLLRNIKIQYGSAKRSRTKGWDKLNVQGRLPCTVGRITDPLRDILTVSSRDVIIGTRKDIYLKLRYWRFTLFFRIKKLYGPFQIETFQYCFGNTMVSDHLTLL